jgi:hypothetical protein
MSANLTAIGRIRAVIFGIRAHGLRAEPEKSNQPRDAGTGLSLSELLIELIGGSLTVLHEAPAATSFKVMILDRNYEKDR